MAKLTKIVGVVWVCVISLPACCFAAGPEGDPLFEDILLVAPPTWSGSGTILELKDGSLLHTYVVVRNGPYTGIVGRKSSDGGRTWGKIFSIQPNIGPAFPTHPTLLRLANGEILLAYDVQLHHVKASHMYVRHSADEGETWGEQLCATFTPGMCQMMPDKAVQLSTGRIVFPMGLLTSGRTNYRVSLCFYSDNGGYSWWPSNNTVDLGAATNEPSVAELSDGRLIMLCRTRKGYLARCYSEDQAETWSEPELVTDLPSAVTAPLAMVRLPTTGDLLLIWNKNPHGAALAQGEEQPVVNELHYLGERKQSLGAVRSPLSSAISRDGGQSWEHHRNIVEDPAGVYGRYGNACIDFIENGKVALVNHGAKDGLRLKRIGVDWFYGK